MQKPAAEAKQVRRELLTSVAHSLRWPARHETTLVLGLEHGGLVVVAIAFPEL